MLVTNVCLFSYLSDLSSPSVVDLAGSARWMSMIFTAELVSDAEVATWSGYIKVEDTRWKM